jgi:hypothetical protein
MAPIIMCVSLFIAFPIHFCGSEHKENTQRSHEAGEKFSA